MKPTVELVSTGEDTFPFELYWAYQLQSRQELTPLPFSPLEQDPETQGAGGAPVEESEDWSLPVELAYF